MLTHDQEPAAYAARLETLLGEMEALPDEERERAETIVQSLVALYGEGLARMLAIVDAHAERMDMTSVLDGFAEDELVAHLLLLHDLHPVPLETRVLRALDEVRPYLHSHGGDVELLAVEDGVARLRLQGSCHGCPSSTVTLKLAIEKAVRKAAPELEGIEAVEPATPAAAPAFVPAAMVRRYTHCPAPLGEEGLAPETARSTNAHASAHQ